MSEPNTYIRNRAPKSEEHKRRIGASMAASWAARKSDPFIEVDIASFSGGRSSGMMIREHLQQGGKFDAVLFNNTGLESDETFAFMRWFYDNVTEFVLLEHDPREPNQYRVVDFDTASRKGEPMSRLVEQYRYLPTPGSRVCTEELKVRTGYRYLYDRFGVNATLTQYMGYRADESEGRLARFRARHDAVEARINENKRPKKWSSLLAAPMVGRGTTRQDVLDYWKQVAPDLPFDVSDPNTRLSNCVGCFYSNLPEKMRIVKEQPWFSTYWENLERNAPMPVYSKLPKSRQRWIEIHLKRPPNHTDCGRTVNPHHSWAHVRELVRNKGMPLFDDDPAPYAGGCDDGHCGMDI